MTRPFDPRELALEEARVAALDWLEAVHALARRRAELERALETLAELDPTAADALEADIARRLATRDLFPSGRDRAPPTPPGAEPIGRR